jgi:molybdate transport system permease protein
VTASVGSTAIDLYPLWLSFAVAGTATLAAFLIGVPLAWFLARTDFRGRSVLEVLVLLPMVLPPTVIGYYLLVLAGREAAVGRAIESITGSPLVFTPAAAVLATLVAASPFLIRAAQGGFEQVDQTYEDAARTLGRSELSIFLTVTVPLAWRGILAGTTLCFARAMGEFGATLMLAGNIPGRTQTASLAVYDAVQAGELRRALVLSLLLSSATGIALWLLTRVTRERRTRRGTRR